MLRAVIFDFDGVITDSEILHLHAFNKVLAQYGIELTMENYYKTYLGLTDADCYKLLINEGKLSIDEQQIDNLLLQKKKVFQKLARTEGKIYDGVRGLLKLLKQNNIPMAICSGALFTEIEMILEQAQLRHFFSVIVSAEQIKKGKPDPEGFLLTLQKLNKNRQNPILPNQCIVIEDSHWGLEAAKAAGMHTVGITNTYNAEQLAQAEKIITRLSELSISNLRQLCA